MDLFEFHAKLVWQDAVALSIAFADKSTDQEHYFTIQRSEESPEAALSDVENVYIELDDQCGGGYGGIKNVTLEEGIFTLLVTTRMVPRMHGHDGVRITFDLSGPEFEVLCRVLKLLLRGYESILQLPA